VKQNGLHSKKGAAYRVIAIIDRRTTVLRATFIDGHSYLLALQPVGCPLES